MWFESFKKYLKETPKEVLDKEFERLSHLNGIDANEFINSAIADYKERYKYMENYKLIDLGLPSGTLWADRNVGAKEVTDTGLYFAWGEIQGYTASEVGKLKQFEWEDYKYTNGCYGRLTKYNSICDNGDGYYIDDLETLQTTDDAVYQFTNGKCRMPIKEQIGELIDNTTYEWTTMNGINGTLFTSKVNSNSIFIPAAGYCSYGSVHYAGAYGGIWSSSLFWGYTHTALYLIYNSEEVDWGNFSRCEGFPIRGVCQMINNKNGERKD